MPAGPLGRRSEPAMRGTMRQAIGPPVLAPRAGRLSGVNAASSGSDVRFLISQRRADERLLWSRDIRFVNHLAEGLPGARLLDLEGGVCLIAAAAELTDGRAAEVARINRNPEYGLVSVDSSIAESDRYLVALGVAVQQSGL